MTSGPTGTDLMRRALAIACAALDEPEAERRRWADVQCGGDATLRAEVASLLAADEAPERELERIFDEPEVDDPWPGRVVGRYRIDTRIGSGGMGTVYRAEPESGVTRQPVALKLIKRGMDTDEILRRFIREREILARLDHPNIARLLDGGMTVDGRPWFALELVVGEPLLEYCDRRALPVRARIALFLQICEAVAYAHRSLVVHRDLKPGNVLITGDGVVKLLDFGIAKLVDADGEAVTRSQMAMMTPDYAAPEQYDRGQITTQTDVYLLGVMLAELLTGRRPPWPVRRELGDTGEQPHLDAAFASRAAANDLSLMELAARRSTSVPLLAKLLRGDIDRITRRAMSYQPERRYLSAAALAEDLKRHLAGLPVQAMDDSFAYRASKFVRRHRTAMFAALAVLASIVIGTVMTLRESYQLRLAEHQTETALAMLEDVFLDADPYLAKGGDTRASDLLAGARKRIEAEPDLPPAIATRLWFKLGMAYVSLDEDAEARSVLQLAMAAGERALACRGVHCVGPDAAATKITLEATRSRLAHYQLVIDRDANGLQPLMESIAALRAAGKGGSHALAQALQFLGDSQFNEGHYEQLDALSAEVVALERASIGDGSTEVIMALGYRASVLRVVGLNEAALEAAHDAHRQALALGAAAPPGVLLYTEQQYAGALSSNGQPAQAEPVLRSARERALQVHGMGSNSWAGLTFELAGTEDTLGRPENAIPEYRALLEQSAGKKSANMAAIHNALGSALVASGDAAAARAEFAEARSILCAQDAYSPPCIAIGLNAITADLGASELSSAQLGLADLKAAAQAGSARASMRWYWLESRLALASADTERALAALAASRAASDPAELAQWDQARLDAQEGSIAEVLGQRDAALAAFERAERIYDSIWQGEPAPLLEVRAHLARLREQ